VAQEVIHMPAIAMTIATPPADGENAPYRQQEQRRWLRDNAPDEILVV